MFRHQSLVQVMRKTNQIVRENLEIRPGPELADAEARFGPLFSTPYSGWLH